MIPIVIKIANWFTKNIKIVVISIIGLLVATIFVQQHQLNDKKTEINRLYNNIQAYEQIVDNTEQNSRVLQLTINELNNSKDSLLRQVQDIKKELKVKDKNLKQAQVINTVIKDTITKPITVDRDFDETLKLNSLTTIKVTRTDSILTAKLHIQNVQTLFVEEKKVWKNKYKNGLIRFFHFDFKKIRVKNYQIKNSNPLIKVMDTRIIEINN